MRVAVTGATGFLGRHLTAALAEHDVVAVSRHPGPQGQRADVTDPDSLAGVFVGCDVVIHAAGLVDHEPSGADATWAVHVDGTDNVVAACRASGVRRLVHISSSGTIAVHAGDVTLSEEAVPPTSVIARWPYYRSKLRAEQIALAANSDDLAVVSLNPSLLLGPGDPDGRATESVGWFLRGRLPFSPSGGLSFADVRDVAQVTRTLMTRGTPGQRYLVGSVNWTFREFYERLARITGKRAPLPAPRIAARALSWLPSVGRDGFAAGYPMTRTDVDLSSHYWWLDDTRARAELDWSPRDPLTTLSDTVFDLRQRALA